MRQKSSLLRPTRPSKNRPKASQGTAKATVSAQTRSASLSQTAAKASPEAAVSRDDEARSTEERAYAFSKGHTSLAARETGLGIATTLDVSPRETEPPATTAPTTPPKEGGRGETETKKTPQAFGQRSTLGLTKGR